MVKTPTLFHQSSVGVMKSGLIEYKNRALPDFACWGGTNFPISFYIISLDKHTTTDRPAEPSSQTGILAVMFDRVG